MKIQFTKMQGIGNDFVFIDGRRFKLSNPKKIAKILCDRRYGVGADQVLVLGKSRKADFSMQIYNADGGEAEMCGNGLRCLAKFVRDEKLTTKKEVSIETKSGIQTAEIVSVNRVTVDMGEPILRGKEIPVNLSGRVINRPLRVEGHEFRVTCVSVGNPHCVIFVEDLAKVNLAKYGPLIEKHNLFPKRVNVEFVRVNSAREIEMRVWERGAGETLACGSGACAAAVASVLNGFTDRTLNVKLAGGMLHIEWDKESGHLFMTGPAEVVFRGEIEI
jgi:diaminopimelate epimerase